MDDQEGLEKCVIGLRKFVGDAERHGVTVCMELLNSKVDHPDYMCDRTGGNPGRHEIDETQEMNYPAIMAAIKETGFTGYVAQEFIPVRAPLVSLREAICDV